MRILALHRNVYQLARLDAQPLSAPALERYRVLKALDQLRSRGISAHEAAQLLGTSRATLLRWRQRLRAQGPRGLEPRSRRPRQCRKAQWTSRDVDLIESWRRRFPAWGKGILTPILRERGLALSESTVGRILSDLIRRRRVLPIARQRRRHRRSRRMRRFHAQRLLKSMPRPSRPGERVQVDTLDVSGPPGTRALKHFTAVCPVSQYMVADVYSSKHARNAAAFLDKLLQDCPFPVEAVQVDGGSEFQADFEIACRDKDIQLFVLPPRSPKLNAHVERRQDTWRAEFYEAYPLPHAIDRLRPLVQRFQHLYNHLRPQRRLHHLPPARYLPLLHPNGGPPSHMS